MILQLKIEEKIFILLFQFVNLIVNLKKLMKKKILLNVIVILN